MGDEERRHFYHDVIKEMILSWVGWVRNVSLLFTRVGRDNLELLTFALIKSRIRQKNESYFIFLVH